MGLNEDVNWAVDFWRKELRDNIKELRSRYPEGHLDEDGQPFWSGTRRMPVVIEGDDPNVLDFITEAVVFKGSAVGRDYEADSVRALIRTSLSSPLPPSPNPSPLSIPKITYDKDVPSHSSLLHKLSNLRSLSYSLPPLSLLEVRRISGNIIPALITTTSVISSLTVMEALNKKCNKKCWFVNLDDNFIAAVKPEEAEGNEWTILKVWGVSDFRSFVEKVGRKYGEVRTVGYGGKLVYADFLHGEDGEFMGTGFREVLRRAFEEEDEGEEEDLREERDEVKEAMLKGRIEGEWVDLDVVVAGEDGEEVRLPRVRCYEKKKPKKPKKENKDNKKG